MSYDSFSNSKWCPAEFSKKYFLPLMDSGLKQNYSVFDKGLQDKTRNLQPLNHKLIPNKREHCLGVPAAANSGSVLFAMAQNCKSCTSTITHKCFRADSIETLSATVLLFCPHQYVTSSHIYHDDTSNSEETLQAATCDEMARERERAAKLCGKLGMGLRK